MPLHVLHVIDSLARGGAERMLVDIANTSAVRHLRVSVCVTRSGQDLSSDLRPESYRIRFDGIRPGEEIKIKKGDWSARAEWILQDRNVFESVEALLDAQEKDRTSLGLVKPREVQRVVSVKVPKAEKEAFWKKYRKITAQLEFPFQEEEPVNPLPPPDFRFQIRFQCADDRCVTPHNLSVLDHEISALYYRCLKAEANRDVAAKMVVQKLEEVSGLKKDLYLFLGNSKAHPQSFSIVGLWYPKKKKEKKTRRTEATPPLFPGMS